MHPTFRAVFLILSALLLTALASPQATAHDVPDLKRRAIHGDGAAALDLWWHYSLDEGMPKEGYFWLKLSAEAGHCEGMIQLIRESTFVYPDFAAAKLWAKEFESAKCDPAMLGYDEVEAARKKWTDEKELARQRVDQHSMVHSMQRSKCPLAAPSASEISAMGKLTLENIESPTEAGVVEEAALRGDTMSMLRLGRYVSNARNDIVEGRHWYWLAAKHGNCAAIHTVLSDCNEEQEAEHCEKWELAQEQQCKAILK